MIQGELDFAIRKAEEVFDRWNDIAGCIEPLTGHYYEAQGCIADAVKIGAMVALGLRPRFDEDGSLVDDGQTRVVVTA